MAQGNPRDLRKEREWRQRIRDWRQSGLGVRAFCAQRGLAQANFYAWRRELDKRDAEGAAFVPVHVVSEVATLGTALHVVVDGRRSIRVTAGFDAATLRRLLAVLEEQPPC